MFRKVLGDNLLQNLLFCTNKYKLMEMKNRDYHHRPFSMNDNDPLDSEKSLETSYWNQGKGKYADFRNEEILKQRARQFIAKIHHYKARHDGEYLVKKQQAQQRRNKRQKLIQDIRLREQEQRMWEKRSKILDKIYQKELEKEQKFAAQVLKKRHMSTKNHETNHQNTSSQKDKADKLQKSKKTNLIKRFKTVPNEEISLPKIGSSNQSLTKKYRIDSKKEKMLYLSNKDRVTISQIHEKIDQLNRIASNKKISIQ